MALLFVAAVTGCAEANNNPALRRNWRTSKRAESSVEPLCALAPVFSKHFSALAVRLLMTNALANDEIPFHYIVFSTAKDVDDFCSAYRQVCHLTWFKPLKLSELIGLHKLQKLESFVDAHGDKKLSQIGVTGTCTRFASSYIQHLKKHLGVASLLGKCKTVWVTDAETVPFRGFSFKDLVSRTDLHSKYLISSWFHSRHNCSAPLHHMGTDYACSEITTRRLNMSDFQCTKKSCFGARSAYQLSNIENWWMYSPETMKVIIARTEEVTGMEYADYIAYHQVDSDINFYADQVQFLGLQKKTTQRVLNFVDELAGAHPAEFQQCCTCNSRRNYTCHSTWSLWTGCMSAKMSMENVASFLVDRIGMYGFFGNNFMVAPAPDSESTPLASPPFALFEKEPRLSWCVNNCFRAKVINYFQLLKTKTTVPVVFGRADWVKTTGIDIAADSIEV